MKKEYIKPEAEMMKFVETEEIMTGAELVDKFPVGANPASMNSNYVY